jgi:hypothetical protein
MPPLPFFGEESFNMYFYTIPESLDKKLFTSIKPATSLQYKARGANELENFKDYCRSCPREQGSGLGNSSKRYVAEEHDSLLRSLCLGFKK